MICLDRRARRLQRADESADQVVDRLDAAVRRKFQELCPALDHGFHPSAWADAEAEPVGLSVHQERLKTLPPVASADQERVVRAVPVGKVAGRREQAHPVAEHPQAEHLVGAMARQVAVQ
jgi:hypothetical protein